MTAFRSPLALALVGAAMSACTTNEPLTTSAAVDVVNVRITPHEARTIRLTQAQYRHAIGDILGPEVTIARDLEPDLSRDGLVALGAARSTISPWGVEQYEKQAFDIAHQVMSDPTLRARHVTCEPIEPADAVCAMQVLGELGGRLWRRPLADEELVHPDPATDGVVEIAMQAAIRFGDFDRGLEYGLALLLQAPDFLYRSEAGEPDPSREGQLRYSNYEMASRLAFFLWNTTPDDRLLAAAERGELTETDSLREIVEGMLSDPKARQGLRAFFSDLLHLEKLDHLNKDAEAFPAFDAGLGPSAREETLRVIERQVFERNGDYRDLFTANETIVNPQLAAVYEVRAESLEDFAPVTFPDGSGRAGLLGHTSILALHSHPRSTSATLRGRFIRETLLCGEIPPPAANVNTAIPEPSPDSPTLRDRVAIHLEDTFCGSCHANMDPIGLGLENFDGIGRFRTHENGALIDPSGDLDGASFATALDLGRAVASHPDLGPCLVNTMTRYATGALEEREQRPATRALAAAFEANGFRVRSLMRDVALSPIFRTAVPASQEMPAETTASTEEGTP